MTKINRSKSLTGIAAAIAIATVTFATSSAFAHGSMGHTGSGLHTLNFTQTNTVTKTNAMTKTSDRSRDHGRFDRRHRRFFAFGYVTSDYACVYKRTIDGVVKICPDDWY
jgi:hypothetical protein